MTPAAATTTKPYLRDCHSGAHDAYTTTDAHGFTYWACRHCPARRQYGTGDPTWRTP